MLSADKLEELNKFRQTLHQYPELSGNEAKTADRIAKRLRTLRPDALLENVGGHGVVAIFRSAVPGPSILVRTDMDALPIQEKTNLDYASVYPGIAHLCGHDGHSTIGLALAELLHQEGLACGEVLILFQPSEENGRGARQVLDDPAFSSLRIDKVIALHNLPGFPANELVVGDGPFACASEGLEISLEGKTAHAAEPEMGLNPVDTISELVSFLSPFRSIRSGHPFRLATVVHLRVGDESYGISPGSGKLLLTIRAESDSLLKELHDSIEEKARDLAQQAGLTAAFSRTEPFAATVNETGFESAMQEVAENLQLSVTPLSRPFRWSEDVGLLISRYGGGLFGLGAGENCPALHNPDYDFPDHLIGTGAAVFYEYIKIQQRNAANIVH